MSMPIQRQSEAYGIFDDGPRFARDRASHDLPRGLAGLVNSTGPRIQAGLLNTRTARADDFGPADHGGAGPDGGPYLPPDYDYDDVEGRLSDREADEAEAYERMLNSHEPDDRHIPEHLVHGNRRGSGRHPFDRAAAARLAKDGGCTCWEGYERVPGTEPCASGSCRKKTSARRMRAFQWGERTYNPDAHNSYEQRLYSDVELHKAPLENGHELHAWAYRDEPDAADGWNWAIVDPHSHKSRSYVEGYNDSLDNGTDWDVNPHVSGSPPPIASWLAGGGMYMDSTSATAHRNLGESFDVAHSDHIPTLEDAKAQAQAHYQKMFPIGTNTGGHDSGVDYGDLNSYMRHLQGRRVVALAPADPAMPPQMPVGGGFQPAHRVGLDWRDRTVPGTVIGVDDRVHVRWDDGQYTSEDPSEVHLL